MYDVIGGGSTPTQFMLLTETLYPRAGFYLRKQKSALRFATSSVVRLRSQASIKFKNPTNVGFLNFGRDRDRTDDLLVANEALSQLSYTPVNRYIISDDIFIIAYPHLKIKFLRC